MKERKVAFFTEAGSKRGMGHLVRTHTILEFFKQRGVKTTLYLESDLNYDYKYNDINYFQWKNFQLTQQYEIIFIDSYEATINIYKVIEKSCKTAVYIDDFARLNYPKGVILNFAPDAHTFYPQTFSKNHTYLLGLDYIPIRSSLQKVKPKRDEQIFIMLGGNDIKDLSYNIVKSLSELSLKKVVVSNNKQMVQKLQEFPNTEILYKPDDQLLISKMAKSSVAISTASMGVYELAYFRVPVLIIVVVKNQYQGIEQFLKYKLAHAFVDINTVDYKTKFKSKIKELLKIKLPTSNIDGLGAQRIYEEVISL